MRTVFLVFGLFVIICSCEVQGDLTSNTIAPAPVSPISILKSQGDFVPTSGISVAGGVKIYFEANQYKLKLENFSISDGPDLKVYLSKTSTPTEFVNLGNLNPAMIYSIPESVIISDYKYVLINCQQYNHLFAVASLIQN
ncbi:hypothetical protein C3L50_02015 [Flavobacterium alvei]|uniref:DM13 domain-containing protein n=1 Tax=Flavobacterium alvei TaxID=2080416 RepID=A0A2S5AGS8_9FLAO|nr:DM13 domain-containing protein [Flavobacterium alvei]POY41323.1 hypothetical protein C3L50_02015 [Flavobacterium alvei]